MRKSLAKFVYMTFLSVKHKKYKIQKNMNTEYLIFKMKRAGWLVFIHNFLEWNTPKYKNTEAQKIQIQTTNIPNTK